MKKILLVVALFQVSVLGWAKEGMWLPILLQELNEEEMHAMGMKMSAEDIYSVNRSSLKDAVLIFGGGCTGELISDQGLVLTNHHCGYGAIQSHSTVENNYLKDGFWAMDKSQELPNKGLKVTFIKSIEDISQVILAGVTASMSEEERADKIKQNKREYLEDFDDQGYDVLIKPFFFGNQYILFLTQTYNDIRLVGAPPSSIGKYGFDTDNWMWPRHNADFSLFRIYAGENNMPAEFNEENKPFQPLKHLNIRMSDVQKDEFTMVYGFPGRTSEYLPAVAVEYTINVSNPAKIKMRTTSLEVIDAAMKSSEELNIKYASKQSRISNAWKKWIGQNKGLKTVKAVDQKKELEELFKLQVADSEEFTSKYGTVIDDFEKIYPQLNKYGLADDLFKEMYYYGPELLRFSNNFSMLMDHQDVANKKVNLQKASDKFFKDYDLETDKKIMKSLLPVYFDLLPEDLQPADVPNFGEMTADEINKYVDNLYAKTIFAYQDQTNDFIQEYSTKKWKKIESDPAFELVQAWVIYYKGQILPSSTRLNNKLARVNRKYMAGLMEVLPDYKMYYPDANFTLRVAYGKVDGYSPYDGAEYKYYTTLTGVMEKMDQDSYEFAVPEKLIELYNTKDFGPYASESGEMRVCFLASNHTTGGNSGSPVLDGSGNLIGLNFDRTWESTMSDITYDSNLCRNVMVDLKYILFIVDKYAGATHLVEEMTLVEK